ncbi:MAG: hypothetical protein IJY20_07395 [Clostridia bacterium]|nr:hypothetical protein [Clostridia bacterium]
MQVSDFLEIIVCMLAVYGIYAILCRLLAHGCYKGDLAVGIRIKRESDHADPAVIADGVRRARFLTEGQRGKMLPPVILLTGQIKDLDANELAELAAECEVYYKLT